MFFLVNQSTHKCSLLIAEAKLKSSLSTSIGPFPISGSCKTLNTGSVSTETGTSGTFRRAPPSETDRTSPSPTDQTASHKRCGSRWSPRRRSTGTASPPRRGGRALPDSGRPIWSPSATRRAPLAKPRRGSPLPSAVTRRPPPRRRGPKHGVDWPSRNSDAGETWRVHRRSDVAGRRKESRGWALPASENWIGELRYFIFLPARGKMGMRNVGALLFALS